MEKKFQSNIVGGYTLCTVTDVRMHTRPTYSHRQMWYTLIGHRSFSFKVRAPSDVKVALATVPNLPSVLAYEITIGADSNTMTTIAKKGGGSHFEQTPDILEPDSGSEFWISWGDGAVRVGKGATVNENQVIQMDDPEPYEVNAVSISTTYLVEGDWEIYFSGGNT